VTAPAQVEPGAVLGGRYEIAAEIGRGGYSIVYRARDHVLDADVALKLLVPPPASARLARERLRREVQAVRGLAHPHIVGVHDFLEDGGWTFVVMDLVRGPDLGVRLRDRGPLAAEDAARIGAEIADALAAAHRAGILHRDVKPQNILLDGGRARLTDFGAARVEGQATMTQTGALVGTLAYLAPEVMAGARADARADIYALGMTLYFALTGQLPHRASPHLPPDPAPDGHRPRTARTDVPEWLDAVVARATRADPASRFPSARSAAEALRGEATVLDAPQHRAALDFCLLCGSTAAAGLSRCPDCAGIPAGRADTLVFVERTGGVRDWTAAGDALARMASAVPHPPDVAAAARGTRALVRTSGGTADRVVARFRERGVPARAVPRGRAWSAVPATLYGLAGSIGIVGMYAGLARSAALWSTTPIAIGVLLVAAHRVVQRPLFATKLRRLTLSPALDRKASEAIGALPPGPARALLVDLVRLASAAPAPHELSDLLDHACDAAADLQRLDDALTLLERRREAAEGPPGPWMDSLSALERRRDGLMQRLLETVALLGRLHSDARAMGEELEEAQRALERRVEAAREVELLASPRASAAASAVNASTRTPSSS
jgi:hypothetical protein